MINKNIYPFQYIIHWQRDTHNFYLLHLNNMSNWIEDLTFEKEKKLSYVRRLILSSAFNLLHSTIFLSYFSICIKFPNFRSEV